MKNNIIKSLCALVFASMAVGCQDYNEQLEGYVSDPEITDVQNVVLTLTADDYSTIASNDDNIDLAAELGISDALSTVGSQGAFSAEATAETFLPAYLSSLYGEYLTTGSTALVNYRLAEEVVSGGEALILDGGEGFPTVAPSGYVALGEVEIDYDNVYYNSSYGSFSFMPEAGVFSNSDAIENLTKIVVTEDYKYYNLTIYIGTSADAVETEVKYTKTDNDYVYEIPAGSTFFKIVNKTTYTASADVITFTIDGAEATIDIEALPTAGPDGSATVNGYELSYADAYYSKYGSYTIPVGDGYISNVTELVDLSRIVITEDYQYYNVTLYVGATADAVTTKVSYVKDGNDYVYSIPSGNGFFKIVNESTHNAQGDKISFTCGEPKTETVFTESTASFCLADYVWGPKTYLTLKDNTTMPEYQEETEEIKTFEVDGVTFEYKWAYYRSSYGSLTIAASTDGYWRNLTEMPGLSKIVVTEDYSYYNLKVYAGTASGAENTLIEYTKAGNDYTYVIPEGYNFVKFVNESAYNASCDLIVFEFNGLE